MTQPVRPIIVLLAISASAAAQDVVYYSTDESSRASPRLTGEILEYTGDEIRVRLSSGREVAIASHRVAGIQSQWNAPHEAGNRLVAERKFAEAAAQYAEATRNEQRRWVRRMILAQTTTCLANLGRIEQAGETFLLIVRSDPSTQYFDRIPLGWRPYEPSLTLANQAEAWLASSEIPAASLMGASWLLSTRRRSEAIAALRRLSTNRDRRVAQLAIAQLWRTETVTAKPDQVDLWKKATGAMAQPLRAGPYFVIGRALARQNRHEESALAFLRVPILYPRDRSLAAESLLHAARQLENVDQTRQAIGLYRELITDYADTRSVEEAKMYLQRLQNK